MPCDREALLSLKPKREFVVKLLSRINVFAYTTSCFNFKKQNIKANCRLYLFNHCLQMQLMLGKQNVLSDAECRIISRFVMGRDNVIKDKLSQVCYNIFYVCLM